MESSATTSAAPTFPVVVRGLPRVKAPAKGEDPTAHQAAAKAASETIEHRVTTLVAGLSALPGSDAPAPSVLKVIVFAKNGKAAVHFGTAEAAVDAVARHAAAKAQEPFFKPEDNATDAFSTFTLQSLTFEVKKEQASTPAAGPVKKSPVAAHVASAPAPAPAPIASASAAAQDAPVSAKPAAVTSAPALPADLFALEDIAAFDPNAPEKPDTLFVQGKKIHAVFDVFAFFKQFDVVGDAAQTVHVTKSKKPYFLVDWAGSPLIRDACVKLSMQLYKEEPVTVRYSTQSVDQYRAKVPDCIVARKGDAWKKRSMDEKRAREGGADATGTDDGNNAAGRGPKTEDDLMALMNNSAPSATAPAAAAPKQEPVSPADAAAAAMVLAMKPRSLRKRK